MRRHLPAGDTESDRKAMRKELVEARAMLGAKRDADADKILKRPKEEFTTSVRALQGGQWESNRKKF